MGKLCYCFSWLARHGTASSLSTWWSRTRHSLSLYPSLESTGQQFSSYGPQGSPLKPNKSQIWLLLTTLLFPKTFDSTWRPKCVWIGHRSLALTRQETPSQLQLVPSRPLSYHKLTRTQWSPHFLGWWQLCPPHSSSFLTISRQSVLLDRTSSLMRNSFFRVLLCNALMKNEVCNPVLRNSFNKGTKCM